ncbi:metallophosphoesterase [Chitinophaga filiformis]|uniref:Calcineurin-like phosphoesterase n=1 Tax=Chitinophaga filiformis TaxID=104663 RepID=A0A1G7UNX9_CHIFI|nr:metallophosphoesterase [Chitinophaga filiformis]SDG48819.1 Calcineurin-like phosphoesterase [Chitinophaga filiformis]
MPEKIEISLQIPHADPNKQDRFFSLRLKRELINERSVFKGGGGMFVISDVGGDFQKFCKILYRGKIIDKQLNWVFKEGHVIILGNCLEDNEDVLECLWLIYSLEEKAEKMNGHLHFILGDKEIKNLNGQWRFRHPQYAKAEKVGRNASTVLYDGSNELWRWLKTKNLIEKIGHTLFVHGGLSMRVLYGARTIEEINSLAKTLGNPKSLFKSPTIGDIFPGNGNIEGEGVRSDEDQVNKILKRFKVKRIVSGYQAAEKIELFYAGKLINVHTGHMEEHSDGLLIKGRHFFRIKSNGKPEEMP